MKNHICQRLMILFSLSVLIGLGVGLTSRAIADITAQAKTLDRDLEPVVINGAKVALLSGAPVEHLFVYTYTGAGWGGQIPMQIDEVTASGSYTTTEDGLLDANDEIVIMARDLGDQAPDTSWLTSTLPISASLYELEVYDPTDPGKKGWAYLVRSGQLASTVSDDYVDYSPATKHIIASQYELGFATGHVGFDYLAMNGSGVDVLDRTKLRAVFSTPLGPFTFTEDTLGNPALVLIRNGPVRVLIYQAADGGLAPGQQASLATTYKAYGSLFQGSAVVSFSLSLATLSSVRTSIDLDRVVSPTTFYNANATTGVIVDGQPDAGVDTPLLSKWAQVSHSTGRSIQVVDPTPAGGTQSTYYRDDETPESTSSTEQPGSYGDSGFVFTGNINQAFSIQNCLFILPPADGGPDNVGATYETYCFDPLQVTSRLKGSSATLYLPIIFRQN